MAGGFPAPNIPDLSEQVPYAGKELPRDKAPLAVFVPDPQVKYNGNTLPRDAATVKLPTIDPTNNPSEIWIGNIRLPNDTVIYLNGKKQLAKSQILDGVVVYERILRESYEIEFEGILRAQEGRDYIFAQVYIHNLFVNIWLPDTVQIIKNTYLNNLNISEIVLETITPTTVRGSTNIPFRIRGYENQPGQSLISPI